MNRLCFFAHFDKDNIVDDYVVKYLQDLTSVVKTIVFISSSNLPKSEKKKIAKYCKFIFTKTNEGYDFGSWKFGMIHFGFANLQYYDEIIITNDSCFGAIFPFEEMFDEMLQSNCDVWSVTLGRSYIEYLQSYFVVFRPKVFMSECFVNFFTNLKTYHDKSEYIIYCEMGLTKMLKQNGFHCDGYIKINKTQSLGGIVGLFSKVIKAIINTNYKFFFLRIKAMFSKRSNPSLFNVKELIDQRCPLLKKMLFDVEVLKRDLISRESHEIMNQNIEELIRENTDYDFDVIDRYNRRYYKK